MRGLLLKYNKVHNESLCNISPKLSKISSLAWGDLASFRHMDILSYEDVEQYISSFDDIDYVIVGDVFWPTGQHICKACKLKNITVFFIQHGQWIYVRNKQKLEHYPDYTLLFGDDVANMCKSWEYGTKSNIMVTGSPRYDFSSGNGGKYVYFSPPVIEEKVHNIPNGKMNKTSVKLLTELSGIDKHVALVIQPHYRECRIDMLRNIFPYAQFADPELDTLKLIRGASKVLSCRNSTVVLDSIANQKHVILIDFPNMDSSFFARGYFGEFATENNDKNSILNNLTMNTKKIADYQSIAKKYIYLGDASERISQLVEASIIGQETVYELQT